MARFLTLLASIAVLSVVIAQPIHSACCYFSAKEKDVLQPAQKAFLTWDPREERFTGEHAEEANRHLIRPYREGYALGA